MSEISAGVESTRLVIEIFGRLFKWVGEKNYATIKNSIAAIKYAGLRKDLEPSEISIKELYAQYNTDTQRPEEIATLQIPDEFLIPRVITTDGQEILQSNLSVTMQEAIKEYKANSDPEILEKAGIKGFEPSRFSELAKEAGVIYAKPIDPIADDGITPVQILKKDLATFEAINTQLVKDAEKKSMGYSGECLKKAEEYEDKAQHEPDPARASEYKMEAGILRKQAAEVRGDYDNILNCLERKANFTQGEDGKLIKTYDFSFAVVDITEIGKNAPEFYSADPEKMASEMATKGLVYNVPVSQKEAFLREHYNVNLANTHSNYMFENVDDKYVHVEYRKAADLEGYPKLETIVSIRRTDTHELIGEPLRGHVSSNTEKIYELMGIDETTKVAKTASTADYMVLKDLEREIKRTTKKADPQFSYEMSEKMRATVNVLQKDYSQIHAANSNVKVSANIDRSSIRAGADKGVINIQIAPGVSFKMTPEQTQEHLRNIERNGETLTVFTAYKSDMFTIECNGEEKKVNSGIIADTLEGKLSWKDGKPLNVDPAIKAADVAAPVVSQAPLPKK